MFMSNNGKVFEIIKRNECRRNMENNLAIYSR